VKPLLIVNPASANGATGRNLETISGQVRAALGDFETHLTRAIGDGSALGRQAVEAGRRLVVAVGGDGTASEVVDGLTCGGYQGEFGFIPRGSGGDFRRSLGIPSDVPGAARQLMAAGRRQVDLGRIEFTAHDGRRAARHFCNVASCGVSAVVAGNVNTGSKWMGGALSFKLASARALIGWRDQPIRWRVDGGPWVEDEVTALSVCNARYFGGGIMVAPGAELDDGLLDITIWKGFSVIDFMVQQPKLYDGRHVQLANTRVLRGRDVEVEPLRDARVLLEVDGEQPGMLPARFTVLPRALTLRAA
jgi:YegS/Rv2252/BmrU family lipid kinase